MEEEVVKVDTVTTDAPTTSEGQLEISEKVEDPVIEEQTISDPEVGSRLSSGCYSHGCYVEIVP